ncbi:NUDIX domain-containing protein [Psychrobacillus glaciei]|uniref:NUDIX domain-containing protein n=1 Tax=Psychrobacillus glaciei TaxID=2283160 RepID=A0A5J6SNW2_9BACI|nr:NUDIX domain-containing protein [Psychrobacillus glaciei]
MYVICVQNGKLIVINKNVGRYINRYDLPRVSLEDRESLAVALKREFLVETGFNVEIIKNIGITEFMLATDWRGLTDVHHVAVFYLVKQISGGLIVPEQFEGQDSLGAVWVSEKEISSGKASPLVLKAFEWIKTNGLGLEGNYYSKWKVVKSEKE